MAIPYRYEKKLGGEKEKNENKICADSDISGVSVSSVQHAGVSVVASQRERVAFELQLLHWRLIGLQCQPGVQLHGVGECNCGKRLGLHPV